MDFVTGCSGILQYPFFDFRPEDAIIYGGIRMVTGHEMTHAFDDQGAQFDKDGSVKNLWTKEGFQRFRAKNAQLAALYSSFTVLDTLHIKGQLTLGENKLLAASGTKLTHRITVKVF